MSRFFNAYGSFVGRRPRTALALVVAITAVAVFGFTLTADLADDQDAFLPDGSELVAAMDKLAESFPESAQLEAVQVVLRGDVLSPRGAADSMAATDAVASHLQLARYLFSARPSTWPPSRRATSTPPWPTRPTPSWCRCSTSWWRWTTTARWRGESAW
ncbi:MAG: hypothetical protein OXF04_06520 [bacterium]|nr:hypothetical protein [bacterium]